MLCLDFAYPKEPNPMNIINPNQGWDIPPNRGEHVSLIEALCTWDKTQPSYLICL